MILKNQLVVLLPQLVDLLQLLAHLPFAELVLLIETLQILVESLHEILVVRELVLVGFLHFQQLLDFLLELVDLLLSLLEEGLELVPFGSGLEKLELLFLELVLELCDVGQAVHLVDHVHQVEDLVHVLLGVLSERGQSRLVLQVDRVVLVQHLVVEEVSRALRGDRRRVVVPEVGRRRILGGVHFRLELGELLLQLLENSSSLIFTLDLALVVVQFVFFRGLYD